MAVNVLHVILLNFKKPPVSILVIPASNLWPWMLHYRAISLMCHYDAISVSRVQCSTFIYNCTCISHLLHQSKLSFTYTKQVNINLHFYSLDSIK